MEPKLVAGRVVPLLLILLVVVVCCTRPRVAFGITTTSEKSDRFEEQTANDDRNRSRSSRRRQRPFNKQKRNNHHHDGSSSTTWGVFNEQKQNLTSSAFDDMDGASKAIAFLFPTRQPRHAGEGVVNLAKSVGVGVGMGILSLFAMPISGYRQHGVMGLITGGLTGTLYGSIFALIGFINGVYQMARGTIHTPKAIQAAKLGMVWDDHLEEWKLYHLQEESEELTSYFRNAAGNRKVKDKTYYNLLDVPVTASSKEIKKAYYRNARDVHPDKDSSEEAAENFRKLHLAYRTLSDEEKRASYDQWGAAGGTKNDDDSTHNDNINDIANNIPDFDPFVFYGILFNSQLVEPYIGELTVASFTYDVLQLLRSGSGGSTEEYVQLVWGGSDHKKRRRQVDIAMHLRDRIQGYVRGMESQAEFRSKCKAEAVTIAASPFGVQYLDSIGQAFVLEASQFLAFQRSFFGWFAGAGVLMKKNAHKVKSMLSMVREAVEVLNLLNLEVSKDRSEEERMEELLPELVDVAWEYNRQDIRKTLRGACWRLFADASVNSRFKRLERAEAIQMLGEEFLAVALETDSRSEQDGGSESVIHRIEVAFQISVMKASGQGTPNDSENMIKTYKRKTEAR